MNSLSVWNTNRQEGLPEVSAYCWYSSTLTALDSLGMTARVVPHAQRGAGLSSVTSEEGWLVQSQEAAVEVIGDTQRLYPGNTGLFPSLSKMPPLQSA